VRALIIWRPFVIPLIIIAVGPASLLPIYTYNFELCFDRNKVIGYSISWPL